MKKERASKANDGMTERNRKLSPAVPYRTTTTREKIQFSTEEKKKGKMHFPIYATNIYKQN
jgi:hypothetical protein